MNVLVISAHPDDEILGAVARWRSWHKPATMSISPFSAKGPRRDLGNGGSRRCAGRHLRTNSHEAADIVGAREVSLYGLPDNRFDSLDLLDVVNDSRRASPPNFSAGYLYAPPRRLEHRPRRRKSSCDDRYASDKGSRLERCMHLRSHRPRNGRFSRSRHLSSRTHSWISRAPWRPRFRL